MSETTGRHGGAGDIGEAAQSRDRTVAIYVALSLLLLAPGLLAAWGIGIDEAGAWGGLLAPLDQAMRHIAFGRTPRFWMGVAGATMMALLLLYPLRKLLGLGRTISVAAWFHLHTLLGLTGPVLILYHCYFGMGSTPANVALLTALTVAASGIFGHFVYSRLSAGYHRQRRNLEQGLDEARKPLVALAATPSRTRLVDELEAYERQTVGERRGLLAILGRLPGAAERRQDILGRAVWLIDNQGPREGWSEDRCHEAKARATASLEAYFADVARVARRAGIERIASRWRLLHLPLFYVTMIAMSVHVYKVWGLDGPPPEPPVTIETPAGKTPEPTASDPRIVPLPPAPRAASGPSPIATRRVTTIVEPPPGAALPPPPTAPAPPAPPERRGTEVASAEKSRDAATAQRPSPAPEPRLVESPRRLAARPPSPRPEPAPPAAAAPDSDTARMALGRDEPSGKGGPPQAAAPVPAADPIAELARRTARAGDTSPLDPAAIRQRLAELRKDPAFNHDKTRFALTGKHARLTCESCHKTTLKDTPRQCIDCHRKDDVHRGRRPDCKSCHVTTDWSTIRRK